MSFLSEWLNERGMDAEEAQKKSGLSYQTWRYVYAGYPTMPCLALTCGKNFGMTPEEVKHLGIQFDRDNFTESDMLIAYPENFLADWYNLVTDYVPRVVPDEEEDEPAKLHKFYCINCGAQTGYDKSQKFCRECLSRMVTDERGRTEGVTTYAKYCMYCGLQITGSGKKKLKYCSKTCSDKANATPAIDRASTRQKPLCKFCGYAFKPRRPGQEFCSKRCEMDSRAGKNIADAETICCRWCGTEFPTKTRHICLYCSDRCRSLARAERKRVERKQQSWKE